MLVVFKSAPILKRALKVKHSMMQLYILKLLKMQTKYLGRQWRKSNMKTMSAIYQKVRHRLTDDWAYGNGQPFTTGFYCTALCGWLGSRVVSVLDSGAVGPGFKLQPRRCRVTVLGKLFTPIVPLFTKQRNW